MPRPANASQSAEIGSSFSDYQGNPGLGQTNGGAYNIDTKPLEGLAQYTFLYNRSTWEQQQKDTDAKVAQLADISNISLNNLWGKDRDLATKAYTDLLQSASDYAKKNPKNNQEKLQATLDWQTKLGDFNNLYGSGKQRSLAYHSRYSTIMGSTDTATEKDAKISVLNKEFDNTDIGTPITAVENFNPQKFDIPAPVTQKFDTIDIAANDNVTVKSSVYNPKLNAPIADAAIIGLNKLPPQKGTLAYDALSANEQNEADISAASGNDARGWVEGVKPLNAVLKNYVNPDGTFNQQKFEDENASNTVLMNSYDALKRYSTDMHSMYNQAVSGVFNDKGLSVKLPPNINPDDWKVGFVDFAKGITPNQLVQAGMYSKHPGNTFEKDLKHTGDAVGLEKERMTQAGENYRASLTQKGENYRANIPYQKAKAGQTDASGNPVDFGNLIYGVNTQKHIDIFTTGGTKLENVKINNGSILDKNNNPVSYTGDLKLPASYFDNSIPVEYNKYVGGTKLDPTTGQVLAASSPTKILSNNGRYTARFENGEIKGIYAEGEEGQKGTLITVDQFQHITNQAAQKGVTKYKKADADYGKVTDNSSNKKLDENGFPIE